MDAKETEKEEEREAEDVRLAIDCGNNEPWIETEDRAQCWHLVNVACCCRVVPQ